MKQSVNRPVLVGIALLGIFGCLLEPRAHGWAAKGQASDNGQQSNSGQDGSGSGKGSGSKQGDGQADQGGGSKSGSSAGAITVGEKTGIIESYVLATGAAHEAAIKIAKSISVALGKDYKVIVLDDIERAQLDALIGFRIRKEL